MITKVVVDNAKLKLLHRYIVTVAKLLGLLKAQELPGDFDVMTPPTQSRAVFVALRRQFVVLNAALERARLPIPSDRDCLGGSSTFKAMRRAMLRYEKMPADQIKLKAAEDYKGYTLQVYERLDVDGPHKFQPVVLKDGKPVHQLHYRSKLPYVSFRFARRAVDAYEDTGGWPQKQGIPIAPLN